jgi:hypothetical protein
MELVAHQSLRKPDGDSEIPIALTAVEAGPGIRGREVVSIDLSEYGDPLHTRSMRMPFSAYLKLQHQRDLIGADVADQIPSLFMIPLDEMDERDGLLVMRDVGEVLQLARRASVQIPQQSEGTNSLIAEYEKSCLARFHEFCYSTEHDPTEVWPDTYDQTPLVTLPPCARRMLEQRNELLLKPAAIQYLVRILMGRLARVS